jgi:hypothetical protein
MFGILSIRLAGVAGVLSLAVFTAGLVSVPSFPTTGAGLSPVDHAVFVNRVRKGDRLLALGPNFWQPEFGSPTAPGRARPSAQIPPGCDPAFSRISAPRLAHVFRRCIA